MAERLRVHRAEPGPPASRFGVVFGLDDRGRSRYALVPRGEALDIRGRLYGADRPVEWWTTTRTEVLR